MALAGFGNPGVLTLFLAALKSKSNTSRVSHCAHVFRLRRPHHNIRITARSGPCLPPSSAASTARRRSRSARKKSRNVHKRHDTTLHCCGAVRLAVCGRVLLRGPSQRVCVVRQHDERHEHLRAADHRRDDEVRAVPEGSVRVSARARSWVPTGADGKRGGAAGAVAVGSHGRGAPPPAFTRTRTRAQPPLPHERWHLARLFRSIWLLHAASRGCLTARGRHAPVCGTRCASHSAAEIVRVHFTARHRWSDPVRIRRADFHSSTDHRSSRALRSACASRWARCRCAAVRAVAVLG
jgi:hypothetical protein